MKKLSCFVSEFRIGRVFALGIALFLGLTVLAKAATPVKKPLPAGVEDAGVLPGSTQLRATVYLQPDAVREAALLKFLRDVQTPGSGSYRQWVSPTEFVAKFGATDEQVARVRTVVQVSGLRVVSVSGLRMTVVGSAAQMEAAFAPGLHQVTLGGNTFVAATQVPGIPAVLPGDVASVGGMETAPDSATSLSLVADGVGVTPSGLGALEDLSAAVEGNASRVLAVDGVACASSFEATDRVALQNVLREAAAQGITVLATSGCSTSGDASFPAVLPEVVSVAPVAGIAGEAGFVTEQTRPLWQSVPGLPADAFRHEPDIAVSSLSALAKTFLGIIAQMDADALKAGTVTAQARLGSVAKTLYEMAPMKGLYVQPDAMTSGLVGNWEASDGLGVVDLTKLAQWFPRGSLATYITVTTTPSYATHGTPITFFAEVKDISGQGTSVPKGTITFATDSGVALGSAQLTPDSVGANASVSSNVLAAGGYNVVATYSGDAQYGSNTNQTYFTVGPEEGTLSGTVAGPVNLGGTIVVTITDKSTSGVGTPNVTGYVIPQGVSNPQTYTVKLTGSNGTASGTVSLPATLAGSQTLLVGCTSTDPSFTCYNAVNVTATVNKAAPTVSFTVVPTVIVANYPTVFTMTVTGAAGQVAPTGTVIFYDNGVNIGQAGVDPSTGKATFTAPNLSATANHGFSATYYGDNNYASANASPSTSSGTSASVTTLSVTPNPPVSGQTTTLQATITSGVSGVSAVPTGTVTFYQDAVALSPTVTVNAAGVATYTSTSLSSSAAHTFYAIYSGDTTYQSSQSSNVPTAASGTVGSTTSLTVSPNPPVAGSATTLTATVASATSNSTAVPTGTVTFYQDGAVLSGTATLNGSGVATYTSTTLSGTTAHTFYAVYSGNTTYAASTSPSVPTTASTSGSTSMTLTVTPNPPVSGSLTTLKATLSYTANGAAIPTGTVTFYQDGAALTPAATLVNGTTATYTSTTLSSTTAHSFTAKYSGDSNYVTSTSAAVPTASSTGTATTTTLSVTPNPPVSGSLTTLKATIATTGTGTPTGTVTFYQDGVALTPAAAVVGGTTATYTSTTLSDTTAHSFTAQYSGDTTFASSTSAAVTSPAASSGTVASAVTITASPTTVAAGGTTTLIATVTSAASGTSTVPTGTVTFTSSTQGLLGTAALNASGVATLTPILSVAGAGTITATYSGDSTYATSTSATPAAVTVTGTTITPTITLTINPTTVSYGGTVTLTTTVTAVPTSGTTGPAGSVTWTLTSNATGVAVSYTQALTTTSTTTATATATITAPAAGNYTVTATCTGTNFSCTGLTISRGLAVTKVATIVTLTADPNPPVAGAPVVLTAYIASSSGAINAACGGTVTFYVNGISAGSNGVTGNQAQIVTTLPLPTGNVLYAVYNGDANCSASVSSTLSLSTPPAATTSVVTTATNTALYTANVVFTMVVSSTPTATNPNPGYPTGSVTFYDTFNGVQSPLGSATLAQNGPYSSLATFQTTGLQPGTHTILGVYEGVKTYSASNADVITVNITDFSTLFSPSSSTASPGQTVTVLTTVTPINGFSGQVVLGCVPPSGSATTCTFSPNVLTTGSGIVTMTITTTKATTGMLRWQEAAGGTSLALAVLGLLWPGRRRRRLSLAAAVLLSVGLIGSTGCTTVQGLSSTGSGGGTGSSGGSTSGTPSGTLQFAVTASGTDGRTVNRHDLKYSVTVQ